MSPKFTVWIGIGLLAIFVLLSSLFTVMQGKGALVARFGKLVTTDDEKAEVKGPGLHFKIPLVDNVIKFDLRLQTLDIQSSRFKTTKFQDGIVDLLVDYYVKWKIMDLAMYYTHTGGQLDRTQTLLRQQLNEVLKAEFGRRTVVEVVSDSRDVIMQTMNEQAKIAARDLGVEIVDVRIKRIDLPEEVSANVYLRMRADRERAAKELRSNGKAIAEDIQAKADGDVIVILAKAKEQASKIKAQADANAAIIYADAYEQDPQFYSFYRSMLAYSTTFNNKQNLFLLAPEGQFFKYFNKSTIDTR